MNTPTVQKVSKFPLKRQVTESRYKISIALSFLLFSCLFYGNALPLYVQLHKQKCIKSIYDPESFEAQILNKISKSQPSENA